MRNANRGFTLVELLVVLAIIGILIGLLIPAVMSVRESARRMHCLNNQRNIGLALQIYHTNKGHFPKLAYGDYNPVSGTVDNALWSWSTRIFPLIEQDAVYDELSPWNGNSGNTAAFVFANDANFAKFKETLQHPIDTFRCPTDQPPELTNIRVFMEPLTSDLELDTFPTASSSYVASNSAGGEYLDDTNGPFENPCGATYGTSSTSHRRTIDGHGVFGSIRKSTSSEEIRDGLSNTLLIGERAWRYGPRGNKQFGNAALLYVSGVSNIFGYMPGIGLKEPGLVFEASDVGGSTGEGLSPVFPYPESWTSYSDYRSFWTASDSYSSNHPGGVGFVFADGSTKTLDIGIDKVTLGRLANISDGNVIDDY